FNQPLNLRFAAVNPISRPVANRTTLEGSGIWEVERLASINPVLPLLLMTSAAKAVPEALPVSLKLAAVIPAPVTVKLRGGNFGELPPFPQPVGDPGGLHDSAYSNWFIKPFPAYIPGAC